MPQPAKTRKTKSPKTAGNRSSTSKAPSSKAPSESPEAHVSRPNIAALSERIAKDNARVSRFMESLVNHVDLIVDAAAAEDWHEVARQAEYLAGGGASHGCSELTIRAAELSETLKNPYNAATARRQIVRLIGACGRARPASADKA